MKNAIGHFVLAASVTVLAMAAQAEPNMEKYNKSCVVCHDQGVAGAPMTGNAEAWGPRLEKGMDALMASVTNGLNAMPPRGMCFDCTDEEYMELMQYMSTPAE